MRLRVCSLLLLLFIGAGISAEECSDEFPPPTAHESPAESVEDWIRQDQTAEQLQMPKARQQRRELLLKLGKSHQVAGLDYLNTVFEAEPEWRDEVAVALEAAVRSGFKRERDWQLLLRSLTVLDDMQAPLVYQALAQFRYKATRSDWQREVILRATQLDNAGKQMAFRLLTHWTGHSFSELDLSPADELKRWQQWFQQTYPDAPPAEFPKLEPDTKWTVEVLTEKLGEIPQTDMPPQKGRTLFEKTGCAKCHSLDASEARFGRFGPNLAGVFQRRQQREILEAIVYPSLHLMEEYPSVTVLMESGQVHTGLLTAGREPSHLDLLQANGEQIQLAKEEIEEIQNQTISIMPSGSLEALTLEEIQELLTWIRNASSRAE